MFTVGTAKVTGKIERKQILSLKMGQIFAVFGSESHEFEKLRFLLQRHVLAQNHVVYAGCMKIG